MDRNGIQGVGPKTYGFGVSSDSGRYTSVHIETYSEAERALSSLDERLFHGVKLDLVIYNEQIWMSGVRHH